MKGTMRRKHKLRITPGFDFEQQHVSCSMPASIVRAVCTAGAACRIFGPTCDVARSMEIRRLGDSILAYGPAPRKRSERQRASHAIGASRRSGERERV